jgi:dihydrofolate reductase
MEKGLAVVAEELVSHGPFDGVIGFSQGACLAAMVASLLEGPSRRDAFAQAQRRSSLAIPYPSSFEALDHPPLKFCLSYCGFVMPGERYRGFYEHNIQTPVCNFIGSLDTLVEEARTQALVDACGGPRRTQVVTHPGGHFVPSGKPYLDAAASFIKSSMTPGSDQNGVAEVKAEDMDVPF